MSPPPQPFLELLLLNMTSCAMEYLSGPFGSAVPAISPLNPLPTPSLLAEHGQWDRGRVGNRERALTLCKRYSAVAEALMC